MDITMNTARGGATAKQIGFQTWEKELLESSEVRRKATVAQLCKSERTSKNFILRFVLLDFLDYYFQTLGYIVARKDRRTKFDQDTAARDLKSAEYAKEFKSYCGRERVLLRRRRTKLKVDQFHIIAQVGQGGYGEVFLARKQETGEVCALKKMRKRTLFKMDEVLCALYDIPA
jgi:cell cycle protein kinase DBF2